MKKGTFNLGISVALCALLGAGGAIAGSGISQEGIVPTFQAGNFVAATDQQVCFDLAEQGLIGEFSSDVIGFKVDPTADFADDCVAVTISPDGLQLAWEACAGAEMLGIIVKGGPNFHVYDYVGSGLLADAWLQSPLNRGGRIPEISHYNVCYVPPQDGFFDGCTPGYWRNHADRWDGVEPGDNFNEVFGVDLLGSTVTLGAAVKLTGGGTNALARHAVAALLNAYGGVPNADGTIVVYPYTVDQVIELVQQAAGEPGLIESTKNLLEAANELGCPLSGSPAKQVP